ncbi:Restriction endonuclease [uncultured archaeon]|nr:Restriction endonuclease [uncultured archaeon]
MKKISWLCFIIICILPLTAYAETPSFYCAFDGNYKCTPDISPLEAKGAFKEGLYGKGLSVQDGAIVSYPANHIFNIQSGTISLWFKPEGTLVDEPHILFHHQGPSNNANLRFRILPGSQNGQCNRCYELAFFTGSGDVVVSKELQSILAPVRGWYHLVATWSNTNLQLYLNGQLISEKKQPIAIGSQDNKFFIGSDRGSVGTNGVIDEFALYTTALSSAQIKALFTQGMSGPIQPAIKQDIKVETSPPKTETIQTPVPPTVESKTEPVEIEQQPPLKQYIKQNQPLQKPTKESPASKNSSWIFALLIVIVIGTIVIIFIKKSKKYATSSEILYRVTEEMKREKQKWLAKGEEIHNKEQELVSKEDELHKREQKKTITEEELRKMEETFATKREEIRKKEQEWIAKGELLRKKEQEMAEKEMENQKKQEERHKKEQEKTEKEVENQKKYEEFKKKMNLSKNDCTIPAAAKKFKEAFGISKEQLPHLYQYVMEEVLQTDNIEFVQKEVTRALTKVDAEKVPEKFLTDMQEIDNMSGKEFEDFLEKMFTNLNYEVKRKKQTRDGGVDLILENESGITVVQAKHYKITNPVGIDAVQAVAANRRTHKAKKVMVVTTSSKFTIDAQKLASSEEVELVNRTGLKDLIRQAKLIKNG